MEVPGYFMGGGYCNFSPEQKGVDQFTVDDLLVFPSDDALMADGFLNNVNCTDSSAGVTPVDSCNSSVSGGDHNPFSSPNTTLFSGDLCVPYDEVAELEWLSNFVEESFSAGEAQLGGASSKSRPEPSGARNSHIFPQETPLPGKARSKRSRAAPGDWSTRLLHVAATESGGRKCQHCATEKTPQWRTGPMGPKTLCNACGVRYKSGRLVPEYRPAASPTFLSTRHSNSHRKVLELRRQKETQIAQHFLTTHHTANSIYNPSSQDHDHYLIHHHNNAPDYRHII